MEYVGGAVKDVKSKAELDAALRRPATAAVLHFWASWCDASKQMDQVFAHLAADYPHALFLRVEAEEQPEISEDYAVAAVPYFVFCKDGKTMDTLEGANPSRLANKVAEVFGPSNSAIPESASLASPIMVTEQVTKVVKDLPEKNDSLHAEAPSSGLSDALKKHLQHLVNSHPLFLFMKGTPEQPQCGFSKKVVEILKEEGVTFGSFDILTDDEVRQGMKKFSNWPTFPQLFCKGELLGGCDISVEMHESGELKSFLLEQGLVQKITLEDRLQSLVTSSPVMLFMKGTPDAPRCGFSSKVVGSLQKEGISFGSFDILSDNEVREGLKKYSNWPTYPQLYYKGDLIGGCDIILELQSNGELKSTLSE